MRLIDADDVDNHIVGSVNLSGCPTINAILIPENATNGDVYEITFKPYNRVICRDGLKKGSVLVYMTMKDNSKGILTAKEYDLEWWNAKYKGWNDENL